MRDADELISDLDVAVEAGNFDDEHNALLSEASGKIEELSAELEDALQAADEAHAELWDMMGDDAFARPIYEAIVEGRIEDAVELLGKAFNANFMRPKVYRDLFKQRVHHG